MGMARVGRVERATQQADALAFCGKGQGMAGNRAHIGGLSNVAFIRAGPCQKAGGMQTFVFICLTSVIVRFALDDNANFSRYGCVTARKGLKWT